MNPNKALWEKGDFTRLFSRARTEQVLIALRYPPPIAGDSAAVGGAMHRPPALPCLGASPSLAR